MKFRIKKCILFVTSTYISRVNGKNVRKISKNGNFKNANLQGK